MPGRIDRKHGIAVSFGNLSWENVPIQADLEQALHCPVLVENDANLAGLSEALRIKDTYRKVLYITVSICIGGVMVIDGMIDKNTQDAEVGHIYLNMAVSCSDGEFASGKAIVARTGKRASDIPAGI